MKKRKRRGVENISNCKKDLKGDIYKDVVQMKFNDQYSIISFTEFGDDRGHLIVAEGDGVDIPFQIRRVFYIYGSDRNVVRGQHANRRSEFVMINVCGRSKIRIDNGKENLVIELDKPGMGLYLNRMMWKEMYDFSEDSVLLCLASEHYDPDEYIRDYDEFLKVVREQEETPEN